MTDTPNDSAANDRLIAAAEVLAPIPMALLPRVAERFKALSDPNRLRLLQLLIAGDDNVNALAEAAGLSIANASKHLALLRSAGFIDRRKEGNWAIYTVASDTPRILCDLLCKEVRVQVERELALTAVPEAD